jgi:PAS domain S-box-containing protein
MNSYKKYPQIEVLKNKILNSVLIFGSIVGLVVYILSLTRISITGFEIAFVTDFFVLSIIFSITIFRKKLSITVKSYITIFAIFVIFVMDTIRLGIFSADKVLIVLIPFSSLLVFSLRKSMFIFFFAVISFMILGYLHLSGILNAPPQDNTITVSAWLINILLIVVVSIVVVIIQNNFNVIYKGLISDLEKNNELISEKERNYREIFNASTDAIFIHDMEGNILDVNYSMLKMYGYEKEEISKISVPDLSSQEIGFTDNDSLKYIKLAVEDKPQVFDWQAKMKTGEIFWVEVALKKTIIGENERILAVVRDIDEKKNDAIQLKLYRNHLKELVDKKTEELQSANNILAQQKEELVTTLNELQTAQKHLVQSEKMASLGILVSGVAHEINNPLNFIHGGIIYLEEFITENFPNYINELKPVIEGINTGVSRTANIVKSLNQYSRNDNLSFSECDVHEIITDCLIILQNQFRDKIDVQKIFTQENFVIIGNEGKLHQAFLNILANSSQAIKNKGNISISTEIDNEFIKISISDDGEGISQENIKKIFDPFFTTKDPGKGTGLGLSITYNIIKEHKGKIEIESELSKGTNVKILLPII